MDFGTLGHWISSFNNSVKLSETQWNIMKSYEIPVEKLVVNLLTTKNCAGCAAIQGGWRSSAGDSATNLRNPWRSSACHLASLGSQLKCIEMGCKDLQSVEVFAVLRSLLLSKWPNQFKLPSDCAVSACFLAAAIASKTGRNNMVWQLTGKPSLPQLCEG